MKFSYNVLSLGFINIEKIAYRYPQMHDIMPISTQYLLVQVDISDVNLISIRHRNFRLDVSLPMSTLMISNRYQ